jgi:outer membrane protein
MKKQILAATLLTLLCAATSAQTVPPGPWMVRVRAVHLQSANSDSTPLALSINNKWLPEVDVSYFLSPNIAAELVLTVPQKQTLSAGGTAIGSFKHLPPSLLMQYHFVLPGVKPSVGAGINYTRLSAVNLPAGVDVKRNSFGAVLQAGLDIPIDKNMSFNLDVKKAYIHTNVSVAGNDIGSFKINPVMVGAGLGWRF